MIFIICIAIGIVGILGTLWLSSGSLRYLENQVPKGSEWYSIHPENLESRLGFKIQEQLRNLMKLLLIWLIAVYRRISKEVTIKQTVKKKVREFLYDHSPNGVRHPSEFWNRVKHAPSAELVEKPKRTRKPKAVQAPEPVSSEISLSELESGSISEDPFLGIDNKE